MHDSAAERVRLLLPGYSWPIPQRLNSKLDYHHFGRQLATWQPLHPWPCYHRWWKRGRLEPLSERSELGRVRPLMFSSARPSERQVDLLSSEEAQHREYDQDGRGDEGERQQPNRCLGARVVQRNTTVGGAEAQCADSVVKRLGKQLRVCHPYITERLQCEGVEVGLRYIVESDSRVGHHVVNSCLRVRRGVHRKESIAALRRRADSLVWVFLKKDRAT